MKPTFQRMDPFNFVWRLRGSPSLTGSLSVFKAKPRFLLVSERVPTAEDFHRFLPEGHKQAATS